MQLLPKWELTNDRPAFYDTESGSVIVMTARVYGAMNELIKEYNTFADSTNKAIEQFTAETKEEQECFKNCIVKLVKNYIDSIDIKIEKQDLVIANAVKYMKDNLIATILSIMDEEKTKELINEALLNGVVEIRSEYDPGTESLVIKGGVTNG